MVYYPLSKPLDRGFFLSKEIDICITPLLTLQPLLENSIFHGVEKKIVGDSIGVLVEILKNQVTIVITNPSTMGKIKSRQGHGIALENVKQRLKAHFGSSLQFQSHLANGFFTILIRYRYK